MPDVGIQVPPNLSDWWPELVAAGATDLGGLSANGDHISPEHPFPSPPRSASGCWPTATRSRERLCVYPRIHRPEWVAQAVLDVIKRAYWSFIPRRGSGGGPSARSSPDRARGRSRRPRRRRPLSAEELTALFAETRPEVIEEIRRAADELRPSWPARR